MEKSDKYYNELGRLFDVLLKGGAHMPAEGAKIDVTLGPDGIPVGITMENGEEVEIVKTIQEMPKSGRADLVSAIGSIDTTISRLELERQMLVDKMQLLKDEEDQIDRQLHSHFDNAHKMSANFRLRDEFQDRSSSPPFGADPNRVPLPLNPQVMKP